jgi:hypothetical protein
MIYLILRQMSHQPMGRCGSIRLTWLILLRIVSAWFIVEKLVSQHARRDLHKTTAMLGIDLRAQEALLDHHQPRRL